MRGDIPIPGSTRAKLLAAAFAAFSGSPYDEVDVKDLAASAGVTIGALYHHFGSKQGIFEVIRDEMIRRILDRVEAAASAVPKEQALRTALLTAYDGALKLELGYLLLEARHMGLEGLSEALAKTVEGYKEPEIMGTLLLAALQAALRIGSRSDDDHKRARAALEQLAS